MHCMSPHLSVYLAVFVWLRFFLDPHGPSFPNPSIQPISFSCVACILLGISSLVTSLYLLVAYEYLNYLLIYCPCFSWISSFSFPPSLSSFSTQPAIVVCWIHGIIPHHTTHTYLCVRIYPAEPDSLPFPYLICYSLDFRNLNVPLLSVYRLLCDIYSSGCSLPPFLPFVFSPSFLFFLLCYICFLGSLSPRFVTLLRSILLNPEYPLHPEDHTHVVLTQKYAAAF